MFKSLEMANFEVKCLRCPLSVTGFRYFEGKNGSVSRHPASGASLSSSWHLLVPHGRAAGFGGSISSMPLDLTDL
jgi:hypothetical protein